jgi:hypothetical protein
VEGEDKEGDTPTFTSDSQDSKEVVICYMTRTESILGGLEGLMIGTMSYFGPLWVH